MRPLRRWRQRRRSRRKQRRPGPRHRHSQPRHPHRDMILGVRGRLGRASVRPAARRRHSNRRPARRHSRRPQAQLNLRPRGDAGTGRLTRRRPPREPRRVRFFGVTAGALSETAPSSGTSPSSAESLSSGNASGSNSTTSIPATTSTSSSKASSSTRSGPASRASFRLAGPSGLLGLALESDRALRPLPASVTSVPNTCPPGHVRREPSPSCDERCSVRNDDVHAVDLADARGGVVQAEFDELHLDFGALGRPGWLQIDELALGQHLEVVRVNVPVGGRDEEEATFRRLLDRRQPRAARPASSERIRGCTAMRYACTREADDPRSRSFRSIAIATVVSETTIPSPSQIGHFRVRISRARR